MQSIRYYKDYISDSLKEFYLNQSTQVVGVEDLVQVGKGGGLETPEALQFLCELFTNVASNLNQVLEQRIEDRDFIDTRTKSCVVANQELEIDFLSESYQTVLGLKDHNERTVIGPLNSNYSRQSNQKAIAPLPEYLKGHHVTLFGPPDSAKMCVNAMNAYHRKLAGEPEIVEELLATHTSVPKWGADDEDSKTPMHEDLVSAGVNLTACFNKNIDFTDSKSGKEYKLADDKLSKPIKRFPGLALPSNFLFYKSEPIPLHLYDFALHLFHNWYNEEALCFYVPKLENEEEAAYIHHMISTAEEMIQRTHPEYKCGTVRLLIVLENPRAILRTNEIIDALFPYFAGASLGWHDYLGSTARLFKEDPNYRIPVKADPDIVIKYIKASHNLLADVVGPRGGIKIGGMYGILPITTDLDSDSFQITLRGFVRDVIIQMKRNLSGFWVAHPDFVRLGLAFIEAWKIYQQGDKDKLYTLIKELIDEKYHEQLIDFVETDDIDSLSTDHPMYARKLIVADIKESDFISNSDPEEVRYNVFQSLQYLTDWLSGNGCVALPSTIDDVPVRVMDDLATAERSRWEVWHEVYHGRISIETFLKIAHEEFNFIRRDLSNDKKIVQVKWDQRTEKWYPVAFQLMIKLMTDKVPVEFAPQLLLPFTNDKIRCSLDPWNAILAIDSDKFSIDPYIRRFNYFFELCGEIEFAKEMAQKVITDTDPVSKLINRFSKQQIINAASFHGDIGQSAKGLDKMALDEQSGVNTDQRELLELGEKYREKFGVKFLISAKGKDGGALLSSLKTRINNSEETELQNAKDALIEITLKRMTSHPFDTLKKKIDDIRLKYGVNALQLAISENNHTQQLCFGDCHENSRFQIASLSKTVGSIIALKYFEQNDIPITTSVNELLSKHKSSFKLVGDHANEVQLKHLMGHQALNMHYVFGVPRKDKMPEINQFLSGHAKYGYEAITIENKPGSKFRYSGAGFILLEYICHLAMGEAYPIYISRFLNQLRLHRFTLDHEQLTVAGYDDQNNQIEGSSLQFPSFAAGMYSNASEMHEVLKDMEHGYHNLSGARFVSHDMAVQMSFAKDLGSFDFMGAKIGLGTFIVEANENRFYLHQGANDGFRAIYLHCFDGPDRGRGFTIFVNKDNQGMLAIAEISRLILEYLSIDGIDFSRLDTQVDFSTVSAEEIVNIGYKELIFKAFMPLLPDAISRTLPVESISKFNFLSKASIDEVSNQRFARAENIISPHPPEFDPKLFCSQGKVMDSWETSRHNRDQDEFLTLMLEKEEEANYVYLSTQFHDGNQVSGVGLDFWDGSEWVEFFKTDQVRGHSYLLYKLPHTIKLQRVRVRAYPDGGLSRIGLFTQVPDSTEVSTSITFKRFSEEIPQTTKPLSIDTNRLAADQSFVELYSATDEHYAPAAQVLSPFGAISMFDGFESARSRDKDHFEELIFKFTKNVNPKYVILDFEHFVNNNPEFVQVFSGEPGNWRACSKKVFCKPYAKNQLKITLQQDESSFLRLLLWPDGGFNRIKFY